MGSADWLRMYAQRLEDEHAPHNLSIGMREAANEIEKLRKQVRIVTLDYLAADGQAADLVEENTKLREALEAAADRMFDAGLNDAWAEARAALEGPQDRMAKPLEGK